MKMEIDTLIHLYTKVMREYLSDQINKNTNYMDGFFKGYSAGMFRAYQDWLYNEVGRKTFDIIEEKLCRDFAEEFNMTEHEIMNIIV